MVQPSQSQRRRTQSSSRSNRIPTNRPSRGPPSPSTGSEWTTNSSNPGNSRGHKKGFLLGGSSRSKAASPSMGRHRSRSQQSSRSGSHDARRQGGSQRRQPHTPEVHRHYHGFSMNLSSTSSQHRGARGTGSRRAATDADMMESSGSANGRDVHERLDVPKSTQSTRRNNRQESTADSKHYADTPQRHVKTARKVIEDLHRANGHERRIIAITNACGEFDHADEYKHNIELQNGAARVLSKILSMTNDDDEIRMICAAIEMVFRAQTRFVHVAFDESGSVMIPLLLRLLERCEAGNMRHADVSILNITKTLLYISRVNELRVNLARHQGMLEALTRVATSILNPECRVARIRIIANLVNCEENKTLMIEQDGFMDSLLRIAHLDLCDVAREYAALSLMDLASAPANQIEMARNEKLLGILVKLILLEKSPSTRESAITALQNLAFAKENRPALIQFKDGIVLEALKKSLTADTNDKGRRRASGALTNLACDETAEQMGMYKGLLDSLAIVATKDDNSEVQTRASMALTKLAASISIGMECYDTLMDALVVASLSPVPNSVSAVLRVKARDPENRRRMAQHPGVLDTLVDICVDRGSDDKDRDNATRAIMHLTNESSNRKIMCNKSVLNALVAGASLEGAKMEETRDSAVRAIERLATEFSNRPLLAKHSGLLVAVAKATEREARLEDSGKKAEHAYLAKPLLMSLLVAM